MEIYSKVIVKPLVSVVDGYSYNAQIWNSFDKENWWYCGYGKYFKTKQEADEYAKNNTFFWKDEN